MGRLRHESAAILRTLPVSNLHNVAERQVEEMAEYHLPMKYFVGLAVNERAPDRSTLIVCKRRSEQIG